MILITRAIITFTKQAIELEGKSYSVYIITYYTMSYDVIMLHWLVAWLTGNALVSINEVTLRRARLVLGWVTVCERVNHLGM